MITIFPELDPLGTIKLFAPNPAFPVNTGPCENVAFEGLYNAVKLVLFPRTIKVLPAFALPVGRVILCPPSATRLPAPRLAVIKQLAPEQGVSVVTPFELT